MIGEARLRPLCGPATVASLATRRWLDLEGPRNQLLHKLEGASSPKKARHWQQLLNRYDRGVPERLRLGWGETAGSAERGADRLWWSRGLAWGLGDAAEAGTPMAEAGHEVAQAVDHAVGGAAHAVGHAASSAWHSVFG